MVDPAVKLALVVCILVAGMFAATLFHRESPPPVPAAPAAANAKTEPLSIQRQATPAQAPASDKKKRPPVHGDALNGRAAPPTIVAPRDHREPPPQLAEAYPETDRAHSSSWGVPINMLMPVTAPGDDALRTHRIVDGDTLAALAERFLGSAHRAREIFEANRDVLSNPQLLPIGVELKIPPHEATVEAAALSHATDAAPKTAEATPPAKMPQAMPARSVTVGP